MTDREGIEIREAVQRLNRGDSMTDHQVDQLVDFYKDLEQNLFLLGPEFWLARVQVSHLYHRLRGYQDSRRSHV